MSSVALFFLFFLFLSSLVGIYSAVRATGETEDYLLASRSITATQAALSAVSTNNSGFMFIGLVGLTFMEGISAAWLMAGWIFGDYLIWRLVYPSFRKRTEEQNCLTIPSFLGKGAVQVVAAILLCLFLGVYAAAQLKAGSKALHVIFDWDLSVGAILGAVIVVVYCSAGGLRASIWTDVLQSIVMIISVTVLAGSALYTIGGFSSLWEQLRAIDPEQVNIFPSKYLFGIPGFILGWFAAGLGVIGQPHIAVRAMVIRSVDELPKARFYYFLWFIWFTIMAIVVALSCRVLLSGGNFDPELALPLLSLKILPGIFVGLILAGLFSATMSTADSQILSCTGAITQDLVGSKSYILNKLVTVGVTLGALLIALNGNDSVFLLVVVAWSGLAATLGPLVILRSLGKQVSESTALWMIFTGLAVVILWRFVLGLSDSVYEALPGMLFGFVPYFLTKKGALKRAP